MTLSIPTPASLAQRFTAALAQQTFVAADGTVVKLDATAPATLEQALSILLALGDFETYLYVRDVGIELMVTTATERGLLPQHAQIWGVPRQGPVSAAGNFIVQSGANENITLPEGIAFTVDGSAQWITTAAITIAPGAVASVPVTASVAGSSGNLAANTVAQLTSPIAGVQSVTSDQNGIAGGAPIEAVESWRARIIAQIRRPAGAGTVEDYASWAIAGGVGAAGLVQVAPRWPELGYVGVFVAMAGGVTATPAEVAQVSSYISSKSPATANVLVSAAQPLPQTLAITLRPDTLSARSAVQSAVSSYLLSVGIGGTVYREAVDAAIAAVAGISNDLLLPSGNIVCGLGQFPILGTINWVPSS